MMKAKVKIGDIKAKIVETRLKHLDLAMLSYCNIFTILA